MTDTAGGKPIYLQIQDMIEARILSGAWPPGARVPSEQELARQFACSRMTVSKALSALVSSGLVVRRRRTGTVVASPTSQHTVLEVRDIRVEIAAAGKTPRHEIRSRRAGLASPEEMARLGLTTRSRIVALSVRHFGDDAPVLIEERLINLAAVPEAETADFDAIPPGTWLLERVPWTTAEHRIRAANADREITAALGLGDGAACLIIDRRTWRLETPITWVELTYPGDRQELYGRFTPAISALEERPAKLARRATDR